MKAPPPGAADTAERRTRSWRDALGPGLITGASDDDPSGIATYAQAGARFGFQLSWTLLVTYPLMVAVQAISARIGRTTGRGIAGNLRRHYPPWILQATAALLCLANTINIGADLGAMAAAMQLLTRALPAWVWVVAFGVASTLAQILVQYRRYVSVLKWLSVSLLAYFAVLFTVHVAWGDVLRGLLLPRWSMNAAFWQMVVAILGTTISPYLLFWQASQEAEDVREVSRRQPLRNEPRQAAGALARIRIDTLIGMGYSNLVALAILVTTAATLRKSGVHEITTAAQAAQALRPVAGEFASAVFALGIIGTGLLAVPVLAGSAAYGLGEAFLWPVGLARKALQAKAFYGTIAAMTLVGALANAGSLNPIKALVWSAVVNGLVAVPVMALVMVMACDRRIMGKFTVSRRLKIVGWVATAVMALAAVGMGASVLLGGD